MHKLPPVGHKAREMFEVADLVAIGTGREAPATRMSVVGKAMRTMKDNPAISRVVYFVLLANDDLVLASVGRRGGFKIEWNFGQ